VTKRKVRVLIVDDSASVRQVLKRILEEDPELEVIGTACDPFAAAQQLEREIPDVITLDVEMPKMDGVTFLEKLMSQHPIPVVICSSLAEEGSDVAFAALEKGAVEIIAKPRLGAGQFLEESSLRIRDAIKAAASAKVQRRPARVHLAPAPSKLTADAVLPAQGKGRTVLRTTEKVIVVGASTGGTEALRLFLEALPANAPGVVIVQHMPEKFTAAFARRLDDTCTVSVKEAETNDAVVPARVLVAPGNRHMLLKRAGARYHVEIVDGPLVCRHRPSVDVLFRSAARFAGPNAIGILMTGMGDDGARGMLEMKTAGAHTIAQDESSCVVFGMPREAIALGGVSVVLPLDQIAGEALKLAR
jgi:two-component system, chemotaxis family, protein-glutamate methylesterase/glutaminase